MGVIGGVNLITEGLALYLDTTNPKSYPGTGVTWYDLSGNSNHATLKSQENGPDGNFSDGKYTFDGKFFNSTPGPQDNEISHGNGYYWEVPYDTSLSPNSGNFTIAGFATFNNETNSTGGNSPNGTGWFHMSIAGMGIHLEAHYPSYFRFNTNSRPNGDSGWTIISIDQSQNYANNDEFVFVTFTCETAGTMGTDLSTYKLYMNGELKETTQGITAQTTAGHSTPLYLGRRRGHYQHYHVGRIGSYMYYPSKVLTQQEIIQNYNVIREKYDPNNVEVFYEKHTDQYGEWVKVFSHDSTGGFFSSANDSQEAKFSNPTDPSAKKYSILNYWDRFLRDGKYTLKLEYPLLDPTLTTNIWSQTSNPVIGESITGYVEIDINSTADAWGGLGQSSVSQTFIDGSPSAGTWWYAIGSHSNYGAGIPGANNQSTTLVNLYMLNIPS